MAASSPARREASWAVGDEGPPAAAAAAMPAMRIAPPNRPVATDARARRIRASPNRLRLSTARRAAAAVWAMKKYATAGTNAFGCEGAAIRAAVEATAPMRTNRENASGTGWIWSMRRTTRYGWRNRIAMSHGRKNGAAAGATALMNVRRNRLTNAPNTARTDS